mgnify:CR=1 FL=1
MRATDLKNILPETFFFDKEIDDNLLIYNQMYNDKIVSRYYIDVGIQDVLLSGVTVAGDSFTCEEYVWVYDSVLLCSPTIKTPKAVAGKVVTETNIAVPNIALGLSSGTANYFQGTSHRSTFFFEDFK